MKKEKMAKIAADMLTCRTYKEAAEKNGITDSTLRRLRKKPEFREALAEAKAELYETVFDRVRGAALDSVAKVISIMNDPAAPLSLQLTAAKTIIDLTGEQYNREEILERLRCLENIFAVE